MTPPYDTCSVEIHIMPDGYWVSSAAQKIKKLSETPVTVHNIAKLCVIDGKNREITKKLVQPVPPHPCWTHGNFNGKMTKKIKWPKITFPGSKMVPKVSKWGLIRSPQVPFLVPPKTPFYFFLSFSH